MDRKGAGQPFGMGACAAKAFGAGSRGRERMDCSRLMASIPTLGSAGWDWSEPIAIFDLDDAPDRTGEPLALPCPMVGIGDTQHPLAPWLDTVVEPGFSLSAIAGAVTAQPLAAAILVQLLRILPSLSLNAGLTAESLAYATLQGSLAHRDWIVAKAAPSRGSAPGTVSLLRAGDDLSVTLDRMEAGNAIDRTMRDALHDAFALVNMDDSIARVTLKGRGKAFSLGADMAEFGTTSDPATAHIIRCRTLPAREAIRCADRFVVEIDGACIGAGLELAAFASRIIATRRSWFQLPELAMGIIPGAGGCVSLTRRIGRQRTALMVLSGRRINARQALDWGLIDALVD